MPSRMILLSGSSAVGKTAVLRMILPGLTSQGATPCICKIDCYAHGEDSLSPYGETPYVLGVSGDICPDHFLVSNLPELFTWCHQHGDTLFIETAGLCHRCSPATKDMCAGCIVDCTTSTQAPQSLGPMLLHADFIVVTKIDMVSQAEREILLWKLKELNPKAKLFPVDTLAGYGAEPLVSYLGEQVLPSSIEEDTLRHTMPMGVCSYCVGECRVGSAYQQGVVGKIVFEEVAHV
ncbi:MAG: GTP-binding protein [Eubacteriales bacterium]